MSLRWYGLMLGLTLPTLLSAQATLPIPAGISPRTGSSAHVAAAPVALGAFPVIADTASTAAGDAEGRWTWIAMGAGFGAALCGAWAYREAMRAESFLPHVNVGVSVVGGALIGGFIGAIAYEGAHDGRDG